VEAVMAAHQFCDFDVAIVGGGPGGCAAALTLRALAPEARIVLLERGKYPRHKVCGEFVSPEGVEMLRELGLEVWLGKASAPAIAEARIFAAGATLALRIQPAGLSLPRIQLDSALWKACTSTGIECRQTFTVKDVEGSGPFLVCGERATVSVQAVINASGRWSNLSPHRGRANENGARTWVGLKAHYREQSPSQSVDLYFFKDGYCGVQPVGENTVNACAMVRVDAASSMEEVLELHPELARRCRRWERVMKPVSTAPLLFRKSMPVDGQVMQVGDAAGFIDPFAGDGITLALQSGALAAKVLAGFLRGQVGLSEALQSYAVAYAAGLRPVFERVGWLRRLLTLPMPIQRAVIASLRIPGLGKAMVRRTRVNSALKPGH
jgi:flavin-dependent dehydrogenase